MGEEQEGGGAGNQQPRCTSEYQAFIFYSGFSASESGQGYGVPRCLLRQEKPVPGGRWACVFLRVPFPGWFKGMPKGEPPFSPLVLTAQGPALCSELVGAFSSQGSQGDSHTASPACECVFLLQQHLLCRVVLLPQSEVNEEKQLAFRDLRSEPRRVRHLSGSCVFAALPLPRRTLKRHERTRVCPAMAAAGQCEQKPRNSPQRRRSRHPF